MDDFINIRKHSLVTFEHIFREDQSFSVFYFLVKGGRKREGKQSSVRWKKSVDEYAWQQQSSSVAE